MPSKSLLFFIFLSLSISAWFLTLPYHPISSNSNSLKMSTIDRAPAMFVSHGGPPTMFDSEHSAYQEWQRIGKDLKGRNLKGIVMVSAHWQAEDLNDGVYVNDDETNPLIYDFYNFPTHFYSQTFTSSNPKHFSNLISKHLRSKGISTHLTKRGLDHGIWVPFKVSFNGSLDSSIPLCQVSLPKSEDPIASLKLGLALRSLRDQGIAVIGGGQAVHNLKDLMSSMRSGSNEKPEYAENFSKALTEALISKSEDKENEVLRGKTFNVNELGEEPKRWKGSKDLFLRKDFLQAHPTPEHLLPALVAFAASYDDERGKEIFDLNQGALCWNMYQWGK